MCTPRFLLIKVLYSFSFVVLNTLAKEYSSVEPYCELQCDFGFTKYSHTVCDRKKVKCGAAPECGLDFEEILMTDQLKRAILDVHNDYRQKVASGRENRYQKQPTASNMLQMSCFIVECTDVAVCNKDLKNIYNDELQNISRCWANACKGNPLLHDKCRRTKYDEHVGQNLGFYNDSRSDFDITNITLKLIEFWYDEVREYKSDWVKDTKDRSAQVVVGHYTQLVWADSLEVGCAITRYTTPNIRPKEYPSKWKHLLLACNYGPGGNYLGQPVYREGVPCSHCPPHTHCGTDLRTNALCVLDYDTEDYDTVEKQTQKEQQTNDKDLVQKFIDLFYV